MREKMVTDRNAREMAHRFISVNLGPVKRTARRYFRRAADRELKKIVASGDYDLAGPHLGDRLTGWDVA